MGDYRGAAGDATEFTLAIGIVVAASVIPPLAVASLLWPDVVLQRQMLGVALLPLGLTLYIAFSIAFLASLANL